VKISLIHVGKTNEQYLREGLSLYYNRIEKMVPLELITVAESKSGRNKPVSLIKKEEAERISSKYKQDDIIILLDEAGEHMRSGDFADFIRKTMNAGPKRIVFVTGGAWGLDNGLREKAAMVLSLSSMTFPHQLVRLLFAEQLYRAFTIIRGIPYHHD